MVLYILFNMNVKVNIMIKCLEKLDKILIYIVLLLYKLIVDLKKHIKDFKINVKKV